MAKAESKRFMATAKPDAVASPEAVRRQRSMLLAGVGVSLLLSALFNFDVLPVGPGGRIPISGGIADRSYKAPADIGVVDQEATAEHRRAAGEQAPVIYDFDEGRPATVRERVQQAFNAARAVLDGETTEEAGLPVPATVFVEALADEAEVSDAALEYLAKVQFDPGTQSTLLQIVQPIVSRMIVDDSSEFRGQSEKRAIVVRELGSGAEQLLADPSDVLTLGRARELLASEAKPTLVEYGRTGRKALLALAGGLVRPNLSFNLRATDERRKAAEKGVKAVVISLRKGEIVVRDGDPITERHVRILEGIQAQAGKTSRIERFVGMAVLLFTLLLMLWRFGFSAVQRFPREPRDSVFLLATLTLTALGTALGMFLCEAVAQNPRLAPLIDQNPGVLYFVIPIAAATMLVRLIHSSETAVLFAVMISLLVGLQVREDLGFAVFVLVGSLTAARGVERVTQRGTLLRAGAKVGVVNVVVVAALALLQGHIEAVPLLISVALGFLAGPIGAVIVSGVVPVAESLFGYTTDIKLLELSNRDQVLLRELEFRAPGTYHHSMMVGHLAEKAAEAIGANALQAKVAGYYHDIGKMRRPHFFIENVTIHRGENRHEKLSPSMSARIIQSHVKDGLEYGEKFKLARPIMRGIAQHHGTSVIRFFFEKAKEMADPEKGDAVAEYDYRYPGPRPQTREAGILMLADSVEAASRTLADVSRARVQQLVQRIINNYFRDGQLDECSLTLRDLHALARSFIDTLSAIRHERIDYPEATDAEGKRLDKSADEGVVERPEPGQKDRPDRASKSREDDLKRLGLH